MDSKDIDVSVLGDGASQIAEVTLKPGRKVIGAPGAMTFMDNGIKMKARLGDKSKGRGVARKLFSTAKKAVTKSQLTVVHFENEAGVDQRVGFSSDLPGQLVEVDLSEWPEGIICQRNSFILAQFGTMIDVKLVGVGAGSFGGSGFLYQSMKGDGVCVFSAGGSVVSKHIDNSSIVVETSSIAAYTANLSYNVERTGDVGTMLLAKEGIFNSTLGGTGTVFIQSLATQSLRRALQEVDVGDKKK